LTIVGLFGLDDLAEWLAIVNYFRNGGPFYRLLVYKISSRSDASVKPFRIQMGDVTILPVEVIDVTP